MLLVRNISQILKSEQSKKNWFSYWCFYKKNESVCCSRLNCSNDASLGALVEKTPTNNGTMYVIGLCKEHGMNIHNEDIDYINISSSAELVNSAFTL